MNKRDHQIHEIVETIYKTLLMEEKFCQSVQKCQDLIMHSFIIGVCFERTPQKTRQEFKDILNKIFNFKLLIDSGQYDYNDLFLDYNKILKGEHHIEDVQKNIQFLQHVKQDTQNYYTNRNNKCSICLEIIPEINMKTLECKNTFHRLCLNQFFKTKIDQKEWPIECPDCRKQVNQKDLHDILGEQLMKNIQEIYLQKFSQEHGDELPYCRTPGCVYFFIPNGESSFKCPKCNKLYCLNCKVEYHQALTCKEYQSQIEQKEKQLEEQFIQVAKIAKYKQCPKCESWIERTEGCKNIKCRCGLIFCYICGLAHKNCKCFQGKQ